MLTGAESVGWHSKPGDIMWTSGQHSSRSHDYMKYPPGVDETIALFCFLRHSHNAAD